MSESFESVYERLYPQLHNPCGLWKAATIAEWLDDLERAHDREIEQARKAEYYRGYEDALRRKETDTWQLDMERAEVARRIDAVTLDGGSHANLSALAAAVYEPSGGWTSGACAMLRDRLVRLFGGASGRPYPTSTYDELGNERQKAIANLRTWEPDRAFANDKCGEVQIRILYQLLGLGGGMMMDGADAAKDVRDRLIHLLGGDDGTCPNDDGTCPNDDPMLFITDELRECVDTAAKSYDNTSWHDMGEGEEADHTICHITEGELRAIADRIDEQFGRICMQQETVLQSTIDGAGHRLEDADKRLSEAAHDIEMWHDRAEDMRMERDELLEKCRSQEDAMHRLAKEFNELRRELDETRDALDKATGNWARATDERDELQAKLDAMTRYDGESKFERLLELILKDSQIEKLQAKLDAIRDALDA